MIQPKASSKTGAQPAYRLKELHADSELTTIEAARELLLEYGRFVQAQPGVASFCFGALEAEAERLPQSYLEQGGGAILAQQQVGTQDFPAGFVAWRSLASLELADAWELKRLWTRQETRGQGMGRVLVEAVEERAHAAGKSSLLLDTAPEAMGSAYRLYLRMGFVACPAYNGRPLDGILYMRKRL